ncbi:DUF4231 domain-containing protein [Hymenobacter convexus]|uniref:DUF4231 domain-containing protein n=1 Tax=Hymenobacter sp. CA1UV-4 TaxID=3063782 RepID=UPI0027138E28|nr:DUF4231 domain-containing protein [Hymenobacter sp. CA1UV-4]MDO7853535.1 DUF4231 domain-containing protein [Hymenobacter sp. CA1UV-4]
MPSTSTLETSLQRLKFNNSNVANLVITAEDTPAESLLESLEVKSYDFVLLALGASPELPSAADAALESLSGPLLAVLAGLGRSVVMDTGTRNWITAPFYQRQATKAQPVSLLGVAPAALVAYPGQPDQPAADEKPRQLDSWHSDFVLVESEERWGSQLPVLHAMVQALANRSAHVPVLALLAGEGLCAAEEALAAVRHGIPLAVVQGSGGLADDLVAALTPGNTEPTNELIDEIIAEGQLTVLSLNNFAADFGKLTAQTQLPDEVLTQAWENFAIYDLNAKYQQRHSNRINLSIMALGVIVTVLAVVKQVVYGSPAVPFNMAFTSLTRHNFGVWLLHCALLLIPIVLTVLVAAAYKFKISSKWFVLRAGAEALKSEIYSYRARALDYQKNAAPQLAARMAEIMKRTMQSEANGSHLQEYDKASGFPPYMDEAAGGDSGFGYLAPERYVEVRLEDQLRYFRKRTKTLGRQFQWLYWLTLLVGGAGTLLAAISQQVWIAVTASLTAALGALLTYRQTEANLLKFNQAAADLDNIKSWWKALSAAEKTRQANIDFLVDRTEKVLQSELDGWVQQMKNALADLEKTQALTAEDAQKWRPAVRFTPREEDERARPTAAAASPSPAQVTAMVQTDNVEVDVAIRTPEPVAEEPAATAATGEAGPTSDISLLAGEALQALAPAPTLLVAVQANGLAASPAPRPAKASWLTASITPDLLRQAVESQNFRWFDDQLNIVGIRTKNYKNNTFGDRIFCSWKQPNFPPDSTLIQQQQFLAAWGYKGKNGRPIVADGIPGPNTDFALSQLAHDVGRERLLHWPITTRPGTISLTKPVAGGCAVLAPGQYVNAYELGYHLMSRYQKNHPALVQRGSLTIYRDNNRNDVAEETGKKQNGIFGINIHHAGENSALVNNWSAGCQVFQRATDHADFLRICEHYRAKKRFTYTLLREAELS